MGSFEVERSLLIDVPVEQVYAIVRDFKTWPHWSPWLCAEPDCPVDFSSDGSSYSWDGQIVGAGMMTVVSEKKEALIDFQLRLQRPYKSTSKVSFIFRPEGDRTRITWRQNGSVPFFIFWKADGVAAEIGASYRHGLLMLKDFVERGSVPSRIDFLGPQDFSGYSYVGLRTDCRIMDVGEKMEADLQKVKKWVQDQHVTPIGKAFAIYNKWSLAHGDTRYTIGYPVEKVPGWLPEGFVSGEIPNCKAYQIKHTGPYRHLGNAWSAGYARARAKVWQPARGQAPFEVYEDLDSEVPVLLNEKVTTLFFPIATGK